ncbi:sulfatase-like hydrolase/transferase [Stratiformator vulcanicus]|uniref:Choline-sulfatase n=1 Tax=Stratiformator vulcanicus TaxID=2527980 RepID=A0A517QX79_9PLAN|nr:sulfatase-like hydrolase/transferase [Stratiformator vulcanicus]QDT36180.1 Choline-sulfatase [Stratiformator vulcanicus]
MRLRLLALLAATAMTMNFAAAAEKPNVLFIAVDDLNDWIGCMGGHPQANTPNMDRLAARGTLFTNAHCTAPLCNPSRASVMTGLLPSTNGVHGNQQDWRASEYLEGKAPMGQYFREHGYWTGAAGKIFHANHGGECSAMGGGHGGLRGKNHPESWTARFPSHDQQLPALPVPTGQNFNGLDIWHWDWGGIDVPAEKTEDGQDTAWAVEQLKQDRDQPFFLAVGLYKPHGPWYCPTEFFDQQPAESDIELPPYRENDLSDIPKIATGYARNNGGLHGQVTRAGKWKEAVRAYLANIQFVDTMVGQLLDALDSSTQADNTIIVLWSDHGWHLGEKDRWHKSTLWEEATRVPLIVSVPKSMDEKRGEKSSRPVSLVDIYPTLIELCDLPKRNDLDGDSLVPLLEDPNAEDDTPAITINSGKHMSIRDEHWRYTRYSDGSEELYDHKSDPNEWDNVVDDPHHQIIKEELIAQLPKEVRRAKQQGDHGFGRPIFNGHDLTSWEGGDGLWSVEDGAIVGQFPVDKPIKSNTFLIWKGRQPGNFELRLKFRIQGDIPVEDGGWANSGVQYRSQIVGDEDSHVLKGYQADIDLDGQYTGILYGEKTGRGILSERTHEGEYPYKPGEWNDYRISAYGNNFKHVLNGVTLMKYQDKEIDEKGFKEGYIGLQLHRPMKKGRAMKVEFKDINLRD